MKIFSAAQTRLLDQATIAEQGITSAALMERAGVALAEWFFHWLDPAEAGEVLVLAGPGNNGGDGLALARMLHQAGYAVRVALLSAEKNSADWQHNRDQLPSGVAIATITADTLPVIAPDAVVVDALFGTGLARPLDALAAALVAHLNAAQAKVLAVGLAQRAAGRRLATGH